MTDQVSPSRVVLRGQVAILSDPLAAFSEATAKSLQGRVADQNDLAGLYLKGVRRLVFWAVDQAQGAGFERAALNRLGRACTGLNRVLNSRAMAPLKLRPLTPDHPASGAVIEALKTPPDMGKRRIFGRLAEDVGTLATGDETMPLARIQAVAGDDARFAASPAIDASRCVGCDACVRVCPEGVLTLINAPQSQPCYQVAAHDCTGCGLCFDICDHDAISVVEHGGPAGAVMLSAGVCRACGVAFHEPGQAQDMCQICRRTNHHKKLFQVLD